MDQLVQARSVSARSVWEAMNEMGLFEQLA